MNIEVYDSAQEPGAERTTEGLLADLVTKAGDWPRIPFSLLLKDDRGDVRGGIRAMPYQGEGQSKPLARSFCQTGLIVQIRQAYLRSAQIRGLNIWRSS